MEKRVKVIGEINSKRLEREINSVLSNLTGKLHDIKLLVDENDCIDTYLAMLIYTPESNE